MNIKIKIIKNFKILFAINIIMLLSLILFRILFLKLGYFNTLVDASFISNIIVLIIGIVFNVLFLLKPSKFDNKKTLIIIIVIFLLYLLFNTVGVILINKPLNNRYFNISKKLSEYCDTYSCDKYETINKGNIKDFKLEKIYFDYNNNENNIVIHTKYNSEKIISVFAVIYSDNELFSQELIKTELDGYFNNFNKSLDEEMISEAFNNRFESSVSKDNIEYRVIEVFENEELTKIKTEIKLFLSNG